jgi:anaerobic ribonucleoside-triphosphate reductase
MTDNGNNTAANVQDGAKTETKVPCEVYSRIVGYLRPLRNWNKGKRQEYVGRRPYKIPR